MAPAPAGAGAGAGRGVDAWGAVRGGVEGGFGPVAAGGCVGWLVGVWCDCLSCPLWAYCARRFKYNKRTYPHMRALTHALHLHVWNKPGLLADCRIRSGELLPDAPTSSSSSSFSLPAHRALLAARCPRMASHFRFMDSTASADSVNAGHLPVYTFPSLSPRTLAPLLTYIYTDRLVGCVTKKWSARAC
jgi:hypothetical protein